MLATNQVINQGMVVSKGRVGNIPVGYCCNYRVYLEDIGLCCTSWRSASPERIMEGKALMET